MYLITKVRENKKIFLAVLVIAVILFAREYTFWMRPYDRVVFLNIGQGDAILLQSKTRQNILIDAGPDTSVVHRLSRYLPVLPRHLNLMIATHPDKDHIAGFIDIRDRFDNQTLYMNGVQNDTIFFNNLAQRDVGTFLSPLLQTGDMKITTLYPFSNTNLANKESNDTSYVFFVTIGTTRVLLMGDASVKVEQELIRVFPDLRADILKIGHHGSRSSTSDAFLRHVQPSIAIVSAGKDNPYGHPHKEVVERLKFHNIRIVDTRDGNIVCAPQFKEVCHVEKTPVKSK